MPPRTQAVHLRHARSHEPSSQRWLTRQLNDPYVQAAQKAGWRSRAAFKLIELDERFHLLRPGLMVVDLGAAPGGWSQVAARRGVRQVLAVDWLAMDPIPGATLLQADIAAPGFEDTLRARLGGMADLVLSDMAPNTTGHAATDHVRIMALADTALEIALALLAEGGGFVAKVFQGGSERGMLIRLKRHFQKVVHAKPPASRKESREIYVVALGFRRVV